MKTKSIFRINGSFNIDTTQNYAYRNLFSRLSQQFSHKTNMSLKMQKNMV